MGCHYYEINIQQNKKQKKIITCSNCGKRFQFPIKPGKTLNVTCPACRSTYRISFVNPVVELVAGRLKWRSLSQVKKINC